MQASNSPAKMPEAASVQSEVESPAPRTYDCIAIVSCVGRKRNRCVLERKSTRD